MRLFIFADAGIGGKRVAQRLLARGDTAVGGHRWRWGGWTRSTPLEQDVAQLVDLYAHYYSA